MNRKVFINILANIFVAVLLAVALVAIGAPAWAAIGFSVVVYEINARADGILWRLKR